MLSLLSQLAQKWEKGGIPLDENAVRAASAELEKVVGTLQSDIVNMTGETLTDLTDRVAAAEVKKIVASDYHTKVYRQLYDMERLDNFRYAFSRSLQGEAGGLTHGWVDFDLDVPPFCRATQPIQPYSHLPMQNWPNIGMT